MYDIVLLGASGYTGKNVVRYLKENLKDWPNLTWAVGGRNESKIRRVLEESFCSEVPILICDTSEEESLRKMAESCRLVLNCVGPYRFSGEKVVNACVEAKTHYVDISGEPEYLEKMQLTYHELAESKGVYVVGSCGFDSVPADLGQIFLAQQMKGDVNQIETYLQVDVPNESGPVINFATWQSAIYGFAFANALKPIRKSLFPRKLPSCKPKLLLKGNLHYSEVVNGWCLPFPGSDRSVMNRTQRALFEREEERPSQVFCYMRLKSLMTALKAMIVGLIFGFLATRKFGRTLLENYPGFFSFGAVTKDGPSKEMAENTNFTVTLCGKGWKTRDKCRPENIQPDREVKVSVSGKNIGYGSTCEFAVQSCLAILEDTKNMPGNGGVFTPGYAFAKTEIINRLTKKDISFRVISVNDL